MHRFFLFSGCLLASSAWAAAATCTPAQLAEILAPASAAQPHVEVRCSASLPAGSRVSKRLYFSGEAAGGTTLDCNGATLAPTHGSGDTLLIRALEHDGGRGWSRPEDITVRACRIDGSVRIMGMAANGEGAALRASSTQPGHTARAQQAAPTRIRLENLRINAQGRIPLYLAPGVTHVQVSGSRIGGRSDSVALYLDAESAHNVFSGNTIDSQTGRELIAIDGSAHNTFTRNRFSSLNRGGIYLYRNCGEGGTVRHQTPSHNHISDNTFFYRHYRGLLPAVWLSARNGKRSYCRADAGYAFGSSSDNRDFADHNTVTHNRIHRLPPAQMIRDHGQGNRITDNVRIE